MVMIYPLPLRDGQHSVTIRYFVPTTASRLQPAVCPTVSFVGTTVEVAHRMARRWMASQHSDTQGLVDLVATPRAPWCWPRDQPPHGTPDAVIAHLVVCRWRPADAPQIESLALCWPRGRSLRDRHWMRERVPGRDAAAVAALLARSKDRALALGLPARVAICQLGGGAM